MMHGPKIGWVLALLWTAALPAVGIKVGIKSRNSSATNEVGNRTGTKRLLQNPFRDSSGDPDPLLPPEIVSRIHAALGIRNQSSLKGLVQSNAAQMLDWLAKMQLSEQHIDEGIAQLVDNRFLQIDLLNKVSLYGEAGCTGHADIPWCSQLQAEFLITIKNQRELAESSQVYTAFAHRTSSEVLRWEVKVADPLTTDRVAVVVLTHGIDENTYMPDNVQYVVRSVSHRLGSQWALQIFHAAGQQLQLAQALGNPQHVIWTEAKIDGMPFFSSKRNYNKLRWSTDFYQAIDHRHEHILIFELDSLVLQSGCLDNSDFFRYPMMGSPHKNDDFPVGFMNGGFTLRKRSAMLQAIQSYGFDQAIALGGGWNFCEDHLAHHVLKHMQMQFPPLDLAQNFGFEQIASGNSCGFHKPWIYPAITPSFFKSVLDRATM